MISVKKENPLSGNNMNIYIFLKVQFKYDALDLLPVVVVEVVVVGVVVEVVVVGVVVEVVVVGVVVEVVVVGVVKL